jgi:hypothetical protein
MNEKRDGAAVLFQVLSPAARKLLEARRVNHLSNCIVNTHVL